MLPYVTFPVLEIGGLRIATVPLMVAIAMVLGHFLFVRRAGQAGLNPTTAAAMSFWVMACGLAGGHLIKYVYDPAALLANPWQALWIFRGLASFGGLFGGLAAAFGFLRYHRLPAAQSWRYLDSLAFVFPWPWLVGRASCALAHDHPGIGSESWLAVRYPDLPRYDLGLLEALWVATFLIPLFAWLDRHRPRPDGFYLAAFLCPYGIFRLWLDRLHVDPPRYAGLTVDQWSASGALLIGLAIAVRILRATVMDRIFPTPGVKRSIP